MWLAVIVVVGVAVGVVAGWLWGVLAALAALVVSEIVERSRRARIRRARGEANVGVRDAIARRRR